jgi:hypothetical protein
MSQQNISLLALTMIASGAVTANRFVTPAGAQAGADANAIGVSRVTAASGEKMPVDVLGTIQIEAGAAFSAGATLKSDALGRGITWATSGARLAIALQAATAAGQVVEALPIPNAA